MPHYNLPHNHGQNIEKVLNKMPSAEGFKDISFLFQQLGDPTRLRILWLLCHCEECVCNLAAAVDMSPCCVTSSADIKKERDHFKPQGRKRSLLFAVGHAAGKAPASCHRCVV